MSNKIILGCNNISNISALLDGEFILIKPHIKIIDSEIQTNFDYLLIFDGDGLTVPDGFIKTMGMERLSKPYQSVILKHLGILTPGTYADTNSNNVFNQAILSDINDNVYLYLKSNLGARGLGQTIVTRQSLEELVDIVHDKSLPNESVIKTIESKFLVGGDESKNSYYRDYLMTTIRDGHYHFNIGLDIMEEYRVIGLYGLDPIIIKRDVDKFQWQANSGITRNGQYVTTTGQYDEEIKDIINKLLEYNKTPWLSVDIFVDSSGNVGVFEFQMEMGYKYVPKKKLTTSVRKAVYNYIDKNLK